MIYQGYLEYLDRIYQATDQYCKQKISDIDAQTIYMHQLNIETEKDNARATLDKTDEVALTEFNHNGVKCTILGKEKK